MSFHTPWINCEHIYIETYLTEPVNAFVPNASVSNQFYRFATQLLARSGVVVYIRTVHF
jgi:hypothetical protein